MTEALSYVSGTGKIWEIVHISEDAQMATIVSNDGLYEANMVSVSGDLLGKKNLVGDKITPELLWGRFPELTTEPGKFNGPGDWFADDVKNGVFKKYRGYSRS